MLHRLKEFKALVENQTRRKIKVLQSDNGREYTSGGFIDFYGEERIKKEFTISYNSQQNGVTERKNQMIVSTTRAMIHD